MLYQLGPFQFSMNSPAPSKLARGFEYRWAPIGRVGRRPAMQFMGAGLETVDMEVTMYPQVNTGFGQLEKMRHSGQQGRPHRLVNAAGFNYGLWCIANIDDEQTFLDRRGLPRKVEFTLSLMAYGGDGMGAGLFGGRAFSASSSFGIGG